MKTLLLGSLTLAALGAVGAAMAADMPVKAPPKAVVVSSGGAYFRFDGSYQSVRLPTYALGASTGTLFPVGGGGFSCCGANLGSAEQFDPRATGYGISGAMGYVFPRGTFAPELGRDVRIEFGGSYVHATASQSAVSGPSAFVLPNSAFIQLLSGTSFTNFSCGPGTAFSTCQDRASLNTSYSAWRINLKIAGDFKSGPITLTPSVAGFGGVASNNQNFASILTESSNQFDTYSASTNLRWTDWGGRLGADAKIELSNGLVAGLGGYVGVADRRASLSGSDAAVAFFAGAPFASGASSITSGATITALLANAEANLTFRPMPGVAMRAFVGLNYDSCVPGISAPTFTPLFAQTAPAAINFQAETSYYTGGGVIVKFGS
jgi:hypothetical protein